MVKAKTGLFSEKDRLTAFMFKALAHPARVAILKYLAETQTCITGDISRELPLGRTTVNQHLTELKNAGLIQGQIEGVKTKYCLNKDSIERLKKISESLFDQLQLPENFKC